MRRRYRKKWTSPSTQHILLLTTIIFLLTVGLSLVIIDRGIKPTLMDIATDKTKVFATRAINSAVQFAEDYDFDDIANITYDNNGNVVVYTWNSQAISEINRHATQRVEEYFALLNRGDPIHYEGSTDDAYPYLDGAEERLLYDPTLVEIPLGQVTGNTVLANLGPKIPINMEVVGTVRTNVIREEAEFGINSAWISFYLNVEADVQVIVPFTSEVTTVGTEIYIDGGAIMGDVPEFYGSGGNPSIAIPREDIQQNKAGEN